MRANSVIFPDFFENFTAGISENAEIIRVFSREGSFTGKTETVHESQATNFPLFAKRYTLYATNSFSLPITETAFIILNRDGITLNRHRRNL